MELLAVKVGGETSNSVNKTESDGFQPTSMNPLLFLFRFFGRVGFQTACSSLDARVFVELIFRTQIFLEGDEAQRR